jgi:hypothetical protein
LLESISITRKVSKKPSVGISKPLLSRMEKLNSSGTPPASTFVVKVKRKLRELPGVKP